MLIENTKKSPKYQPRFALAAAQADQFARADHIKISPQVHIERNISMHCKLINMRKTLKAETMLDHPGAKKLIQKRLMPMHRFGVGVKVLCKAPNGPEFEVIKLLPDGGQGPQYRVKSCNDARERVVTENMLKVAPKAALL